MIISEGARLRWRGTFSADQDYSRGDLVAHAGALYVLLSVESLSGPTPSTDGPWQLVITAGAGGSMSGAEIVAALNAALGSTDWQLGSDDLPVDLDFGVVDADSIEVTSSTGTSVVLHAATESIAGVMSAADKKITNRYPNLDETHTASETIPDPFVVVVEESDGRVRPVNIDDVDDAYRVLGITLTAVSEGDSVTVRTAGRIDGPGEFAFSPAAPVFCGEGGLPTQTSPAGAFLLIVGYAVSTTAFLVRLQVPIEAVDVPPPAPDGPALHAAFGGL